MNFIKWYVLYLYGLVLKQYSTPFPLGEDAENTFLQTLNPLYHADTDIWVQWFSSVDNYHYNLNG